MTEEGGVPPIRGDEPLTSAQLERVIRRAADLQTAREDVPERLDDSKRLISAINHNCNRDRARISCHIGVEQRREALAGAGFEGPIVVDARQWRGPLNGLRQSAAAWG